MQFIRTTHAYAKNIHDVELDSKEAAWSDYRLITAVDRYGKLSDEDWQAIENGQHPGHFGGEVSKHVHEDGSASARVTVYTD